MDSIELWVLLKTQYDEHHYNGWQLTQIQRKFLHIKSDVNEVYIVTGLQSAYLGRKVTKNQSEALIVEYCTNLTNAL